LTLFKFLSEFVGFGMMERNGLPSFSVSNTQDDASTFTLESEETERFMSEHQDLDKIISLLSYNATYVELLDQVVAKVDAAIAQNRAAQAAIRSQLSSASTTGGPQKQRQITNALPCWPPYFKDSIGMVGFFESIFLIQIHFNLRCPIQTSRLWRLLASAQRTR